jgi:alpha-galactosidase
MTHNRRTFLQGLSAASLLELSGAPGLPGLVSSGPKVTDYEPGQNGHGNSWSQLTVTPTAAELAEADAWTAAKFQGVSQTESARAYIVVLNHEGGVNFNPDQPFERNGRAGNPLRLAGKAHSRGLFAHSATRLAVHLPGPARTFQATVGVDDHTSGCAYRGVIFSVSVQGNQRFHSAKLSNGTEGLPLSVDLAGAGEFVIDARNADFQECSDAVWADASVTLQDGRVLWLDELPIGPLRDTYTADPPFSFTYGGDLSEHFLKNWAPQRSVRKLDATRSEHTIRCRDPKAGLEVRAVATQYHDFPIVEWTLYFKNSGSSPTEILEDIQPLDSVFERNNEDEFLLHHFKGSQETPTDYRPYEMALAASQSQRISAAGGRSTNTDLSYFNLEWRREGVILSIGWPGQWAIRFERDNARGMRIRAGQELTHFRLLPGEEVRSPRIVTQFWKGDWVRAQNIWRRWMVAHNMPRVDGNLLPPLTATGGLMTDLDANAVLDRYIMAGIKPDYLWMDAGWYPLTEGWWTVGTWEPDPKRFPRGLRPITDYAHARGIRSILWFEPERVAPGTWLANKHPEWLLRNSKDAEAEQDLKGDRLLYLGNDQALAWLIDHVDQLLTGQGIDFYREDFNFDPLLFWRGADAPDRQGITEIRHVSGHLAFWDALLARHPNLWIDSCASGGRRNDVDSLRRAVPLWRSDCFLDPSAMQQQTYGVAFWMPYFGTSASSLDAYEFLSQMTPSLSMGFDLQQSGAAPAQARRLVEQWRQVAADYYGDYYPLTPYNATNDQWLAWQFDRPESGEGIVQAFLRPLCDFKCAQFRLRGLDPAARYRVSRLDTPESTDISGQELLERGLTITITDRPVLP